jgi:hypothetical protein
MTYYLQANTDFVYLIFVEYNLNISHSSYVCNFGHIMFRIECLYMSINHVINKFHIPAANGLLLLAIKPKTNSYGRPVIIFHFTKIKLPLTKAEVNDLLLLITSWPYTRRALESLPPHEFRCLLGSLFDPEDGGDMLLRNVWLYPNSTALQPRKLYSSYSSPWERQIQQMYIYLPPFG